MLLDPALWRTQCAFYRSHWHGLVLLRHMLREAIAAAAGVEKGEMLQ